MENFDSSTCCDSEVQGHRLQTLPAAGGFMLAQNVCCYNANTRTYTTRQTTGDPVQLWIRVGNLSNVMRICCALNVEF